MWSVMLGLQSAAVGVDTGQHKAIATALLSQIELEGALDPSGYHLLSSLRAG